jgi:threonylcarbamoyladenosine tRNA methylthiotransferase MtaB
LIDRGYREMVLTGIHLGHYGVDGNVHKPKDQWNRLSTLLRRLAQLPGEFRLRLSSIEATEVTRELLDVMSEHADRVCPHLHVCLQSGSDRILRRMKRRWGSQRFIDRCGLASERLDRPALTTDVIVGFPGETDEDFEQTCQVVRQVGFCKVHVFPFSGRRGTPAATMPGQVPPQLKSARSAELANIEAQQRLHYVRKLIGGRLDVLVEQTMEEGFGTTAVGTACRYVPVKLASGVPGQIVSAHATHVDPSGQLWARA